MDEFLLRPKYITSLLQSPTIQRRFKISISQISQKAEELASNFERNPYLPTPLRETNRGKKIFYAPSQLADAIVHQHIARCLKRHLPVSSCSRQDTILHLKAVLNTDHRTYILRTDIRKCFQTVNIPVILEKIHLSGCLRPKVFAGLREILISERNLPGLPWGLHLSSLLLDYYLIDLDRELRSLPGVSFFCRYVDDMLLVSSKEFTISAINEIRNLIPQKQRLNRRKTHTLKWCEPHSNNSPNHLDFLGYRFCRDNVDKKVVRALLTISPTKLRRRLDKIDASIKSYLQKRDCKLLLDRVRYITSNFAIHQRSRKGTLLAGIYYSYQHADQSVVKDLIKLDRILRKKLKCCVPKPDPIRSKIFWRQILACSFERGFTDKKIFSYSPRRINEINAAWK